MQCQFIKADGTQCKHKAMRGKAYCWTPGHEATGLSAFFQQPGDRPAAGKVAELESHTVESKAHPKTSMAPTWHFASLGGPEGIGVVEYGLPECKDEKLVAEILATPYLQLISCHKNGTILNRFMAKPCAANYHEEWRMGLPGLSSRFPENHFDAGILVGPQPGDVVEAMQRLVKGPVIRV